MLASNARTAVLTPLAYDPAPYRNRPAHGSIFGLTASQISLSSKAATKMVGLGEGVSAHSPRVRVARDPSATGGCCRR